MPDSLVIRLRGTPDNYAAEWMPVDAMGARTGNIGRGVLTDLASLAADRRVIALVPGTDVLLAEPVLPAKSGNKAAQLVPYALEEQLASDVDDLHFAIGKRDPQQQGTPVAVVAKARLNAWLDLLKQANVAVECMYAETAGLPITPAGVTLLIEGTRVYVRRENKAGAVIDVDPLIEGLQLALDSGAESREHVTLYVTEDDYERERDLLEGLREFTASLQLKLLPEGPLPLMASTVTRNSAVNLLQGAYEVESPLKNSLAPWKYAAALAGVLIVAHVGYKGMQAYQLAREEAEVDAAIQQVFQAAMPGAPLPDPMQARSQMEARLVAVRGATVSGGFLGALDTLSTALSAAPGTRLEALSYRSNTTDLRLTAPDVDAIERLRQGLAANGATADIQSATPRENQVEGRVQIKSAGA